MALAAIPPVHGDIAKEASQDPRTSDLGGQHGSPGGSEIDVVIIGQASCPNGDVTRSEICLNTRALHDRGAAST
jgi:hypothetical protein